MTKAGKNQVLIADDHMGDLDGLVDLIEGRGYSITTATNEREARLRLEEVEKNPGAYALLIIDVMMSIADIDSLTEKIDDSFFEESRDSGIRLCRYACKELKISPQKVPLVCVSVRPRNEMGEVTDELGIPFFDRTDTDGLRKYLKENLPKLKPLPGARS